MAEIADNGLNRRIVEAEAVTRECEEVDADIAALKVAYEQYFLGVERLPPTDDHKALQKRLQKLRNSYVRQTALKFRIQNLQTKFNSYDRLWQRTLKEIEDGTYKRDLFKARLRSEKKKEKKAEQPAAEEAKTAAEAAAPGPDQKAGAPTQPGIPPVAPVVGTPTLPGVPPVAPVRPPPFIGAAVAAKSSTGIPAVAPVVPPLVPPRDSSPNIPAVSPVTRSSPAVPAAAVTKSSTGIPAVAPAPAGMKSSTGIPAVAPASAGMKSSTGIPAVAPAPGPTTRSSANIPAVSPDARTVPGGSPAVPSRAVTVPGMGAVPPRPASSPSSPRVPPVPVSTHGDGGVSEAKLKAVYEAYVTAKKRCQEDVSKLTYESVAANLRKQVPELMKKHNASGVEFKVVIKDGKAVLKAVPK